MPVTRDAQDRAEPTIVVMAKKPALGTVKTRLGAVLSDEGRLRLYEAFLADKIDQVRRVPGARAVVAVAPPDAPESILSWTGGDVDLVAQEGADLGERLSNLAARHFATSASPLLLVDSDTPTLPPSFFEEAVRALRSDAADVVLGPASDGGYYLIGLRAPQPALFEGISWSTSRVLSQTLDRAHDRGLAVHFLQSWRDIDTPDDLEALATELSARPSASAGFPERTARVVAELLPDRAMSPSARVRMEHWRSVASRPVYENRWLRVTENVVALPQGGHTLYGVVHTGPCVGILPLVDDAHVVLVRQFRYVARRFTWEIPTGGVHRGEALEAAALRELREEAGYSARRLEPLVAFTPSKSILDETAHLFVARDLSVAPAPSDDTEEFAVQIFSLSDAVAMAKRGEILDSMSIIALLMA